LAVLARVAADQPIDAHQHAGPAGAILEPVEPLPERVGLLDAHGSL